MEIARTSEWLLSLLSLWNRGVQVMGHCRSQHIHLSIQLVDLFTINHSTYEFLKLRACVDYRSLEELEAFLHFIDASHLQTLDFVLDVEVHIISETGNLCGCEGTVLHVNGLSVVPLRLYRHLFLDELGVLLLEFLEFALELLILLLHFHEHQPEVHELVLPRFIAQLRAPLRKASSRHSLR